MELLRRTRQHMEEAVKEKIFTVRGPYPVTRNVLQALGCVEKFSNTVRVGTRLGQQQGTWKLLDEEDEDGGDEQWEAVLHPEPGSASGWTQPSVEIPEPPEEEDAHWYDEDLDGIHDIMSSMVRDQPPTFIWTSQCEDVSYQLLQQNQVLNHFTGIRAFTTKSLMDTKPPVMPKSPVVSSPLRDTKPPLVPKPRGRTTQLPWAGAAQVQPAPLGQLSSFFSSGSVPEAPPQPSPLLQRAQVALPQRVASALPRAPAPPAAVPPRTLPACPGQRSHAAGRGHATAPGGRQKSCDAEGHEGGDSFLPTLSGAARLQPLSPYLNQNPSLHRDTHPTHRGGDETRY